MRPITILVGGAFAALLLYRLFVRILTSQRQRSFTRARGCLPATELPRRDKLLGTDLFFHNVGAIKEHRFLEANAKQFQSAGVNTFLMHALVRHTHMTIEPENLKSIQSVDFKSWGFPAPRKMGFRPLLGNGIFTTDGREWQHSRDLLRPNFVRSQVSDLSMFERHVQHLIRAIPLDGTVDLSELFFRLTIDSATEFLFGESTETLSKGSAQGFSENFSRAQAHITTLSRFGVWAKLLLPSKQFVKDRKFVHDFVDHYVELALAKRQELLSESTEKLEGRYIFINELVRQTVDPIQIRSELLNILLAGRDTTASLLTNVWFILSQQPTIWQKLQADVAKLNGQAPSFEQLKELKYLMAVLSESLRLHPVIPMNAREAQVDTVLPRGGGPDGRSPLFIPKGGVVAWNVYAMHRRKDLFGEDAEEFRPERWLDDGDKKGLRTTWEYLPFNGGARICLGQQFALAEAGYATVRLCQTFSDVECRDEDGIWRENLTLTCVNLGGAKVKLTHR